MFLQQNGVTVANLLKHVDGITIVRTAHIQTIHHDEISHEGIDEVCANLWPWQDSHAVWT